MRSWLACMVAEEARSANSSNLLADTVLGLSAGAVELLIEGTRVVGDAGALEGGDDKARIGALQRVLGLADDAARAAPAVDRAILEVAEHARRLARGCT